MVYLRITKNILLCKDQRFGSFNEEIVSNILRNVVSNFDQVLNKQRLPSCSCQILYRESFPMCCSDSAGHSIYLSTKDNYWCQWLYQFAHEYCHHLINGTMLGDIVGLIWFEETICELSSLYNLYVTGKRWGQLSQLYSDYAIYFLQYFQSLCDKNLSLRNEMQSEGFFERWFPILNEPKYHRDYYNAMAVQMLPLFIENPHLWNIILDFGDMRKRSSLQELFSCLESKATDDYADSLNKLKRIFFLI